MTKLTSYCDIILGNEEDAEKHFGPEGLDTNPRRTPKSRGFFISLSTNAGQVSQG